MLERAKIGARRLRELVASIILSFGPKPGVTEGCCCLTASAWLIWMNCQTWPTSEGRDCVRKASALGGVRVMAVRRAALIGFYVWAGDSRIHNLRQFTLLLSHFVHVFMSDCL